MTAQTTISHHEMIGFLEDLKARGPIYGHPSWHLQDWLQKKDASFAALPYPGQVEEVERLLKQYDCRSLMRWSDGCWRILP